MRSTNRSGTCQAPRLQPLALGLILAVGHWRPAVMRVGQPEMHGPRWRHNRAAQGDSKPRRPGHRGHSRSSRPTPAEPRMISRRWCGPCFIATNGRRWRASSPLASYRRVVVKVGM